ncbi:MAG: Hsp33 family molecular chaperone HslO [Candidatus Hydrothermota bacterium]|nr:MAG: Hsp33 family molecular chaperone HslO [Candidatus Hydrothermae bacterium]
MDRAIRALIGEGEFTAFVAVTKELVEESRLIHGTFPTATAALGRALTLVGLMGLNLKGREKVSIQILSEGPIREIYAQGDPEGNVRGFIRWPDVDLPPTSDGKLNVEGALGRRGMLYVLRDFGYGEPYMGMIPLKSGGIATDLAYYFTISEGIPSAVAAGVLVGKKGEVLGAGGFIVQPLPGTSENRIQALEENIKKMPQISRQVAEGATPEDILQMIAQGLGAVVLAHKQLQYRCSCSRERAERALLSLGEAELIDMIDRDGGAEVKCEFCGRKYQFSRADLELILSRIKTRGN